MAPEDDPEKRIRELERAMADAANASELGTTGQSGRYAPPPPPPPPPPGYESTPYGTQFPGAPIPGVPYPTAAPKSSSGMRVGWIVLGFLILGLVVGGIATFAKTVVSSTHLITTMPTKPSVSGGGGPFATGTGRPSAPIDAPTPESPSIPAATESAPPPGGTISVAGVGEDKTIACDDNNVSISGVSNHVVLTGHCARIDVSGVENVVTADAADAINASGMHNRVTFHSGSPDIDQSGISNSVSQG